MLLQPSLDGFGFVNLVIVQNQEDAFDFWPADIFQALKQLSKQRVVFLLSDDVMNLTRPIVEGGGQILLLILSRGRNFSLCAFGHPLIADFRQEMNVELIAPEESVRRP